MKTLKVKVIKRLLVFSSLFLMSFISGNPNDFTNNMSLDNETFLTKLIAPNYGKVQVINIGASWCTHCKPVLEQLATLMEEYSGKDVHFAFICVTPNDKASRDMYQERGIDAASVHFTTNEEYHSLITTITSQLALPYGILINRKGVIVDEGSHVRPAGMLGEKINLLLTQDELTK